MTLVLSHSFGARRMAPLAAALALAIAAAPAMAQNAAITPPSPDPRVGLSAGVQDAGQAIWNLTMVSHTDRPDAFAATNSDLAFFQHYVIQGNYNGIQIWDVQDPAHPSLADSKSCPASQDDVSVFGNLMFVSSETAAGRLDCGAGGTANDPGEELRGVRIFDISDIHNPRSIANVQTCRGSHTHSVVDDPKDPKNVYIYVSGTSSLRPSKEVPHCNPDPRSENTSNFRIEVIKVPLDHPEQAAVVSAPPIFATGAGNGEGLVNTAGHGASPADADGGGRGRGGRGGGRGGFNFPAPTATFVKPVSPISGQIAQVAGVGPNSTAADSAAFKRASDSLVALGFNEIVPGGRGGGRGGFVGRGRGGARPLVTADDSLAVWSMYAMATLPVTLTPTSSHADSANYWKVTDSLRALGLNIPFPTPSRGTLQQCHDITAYPFAGYAGGACAGMGLLLNIADKAHPTRLDAVSDSNFSYWHSATFSNDGKMVLFSDEWGGGGAAYCREKDPMNWGGDAIFRIVNGKMVFQSYYKMPAAQTPYENCVAHNGSLIPIPGRTVMVQAFYQGGFTVFEWTDPTHPKEIAYFDRGPMDSTRLVDAGYWSVYWYNGHLYGSEIARGFDVFDLQPSPALSQNEIDAAKTVRFDYFNVQDQQHFVWPASFALSGAYTDQLERNNGLSANQIAAVRSGLSGAQGKSGAQRKVALTRLATQVTGYEAASSDRARVQWLASSIKDLANATR